MTAPYDNNPDGTRPDVEAMSTKDLLEQAVVDAFGLLDDEDRRAFDAAFGASPAVLRDLIRAQQAHYADCGEILPNAEIPPALRAKVLARLRAEIDRTATPAAPAPARGVTHAVESRPPRLQRARRVNPAWRVAAVAFSVAAVALGVLHVQLRREFNTVQDRAGIAALIEAVGTEHIETTLFDASANRFHFSPVGEVGRARAMLLHKPDSAEARLYITNFSTRTPYKVVVLDEQDNPVETVASFEATGLISGVNLPVRGGGEFRLAIMTDEAEPTLLFVAQVRFA